MSLVFTNQGLSFRQGAADASVLNVKSIYKVTVSINPGSIAATTRGSGTATVKDLAVGDVVIAVAHPGIADDLIYVGAEVSAADTVKINLYNPTAGAIDDGAISWTFLVIDLT